MLYCVTLLDEAREFHGPDDLVEHLLKAQEILNLATLRQIRLYARDIEQGVWHPAYGTEEREPLLVVSPEPEAFAESWVEIGEWAVERFTASWRIIRLLERAGNGIDHPQVFVRREFIAHIEEAVSTLGQDSKVDASQFELRARMGLSSIQIALQQHRGEATLNRDWYVFRQRLGQELKRGMTLEVFRAWQHEMDTGRDVLRCLVGGLKDLDF
ncbi:MAG: hypothetical protein ACYCYO_00100 [Bacilli bacterium]